MDHDQLLSSLRLELETIRSQMAVMEQKVTNSLNPFEPEFVPRNRNPKPGDIMKYDGKSTEWSAFWLQAKHYFQMQPDSYVNDSLKVSYLITRFEGPILHYVEGLNNHESQTIFQNLEQFKAILAEMFYDPNIRIEAENKLYTLVQRKTIPEHIKLFEMLCSEAGVAPETLVKTSLHSLKEEVHRKIAEVAADTENPKLMEEYPKIKNWLLGYHSRLNTKYSSFRPNPGFSHQNSRGRFESSASTQPNVVPMDLSVVETTVLKDMDPDARGLFISTCKSQGRCYGCGSKGHLIATCAARINKADSAYLFSISSIKRTKGAFVIEISLSGRIVNALVDSGAQGYLYMSQPCVTNFKFTVVPAESPVISRGYDKKNVEFASQMTDAIEFQVANGRFNERFLVSQHLPCDVLLGWDFLTSHGAVINCRQEKLSFEEESLETQGLSALQAAPPMGCLNLNNVSSTSIPPPRDLKHEYYTPVEIVTLAKAVAGVDHFDLDPASSQIAQEYSDIALRFDTKEDEGLKQKWYGHVFLNPPYRTLVDGKLFTSADWVERALQMYHSREVKSVTMLIRWSPNLQYVHKIRKLAIACGLSKRLRFYTPEGPCLHPARDSHLLAYLGPRMREAHSILKPWGEILSEPMVVSEALAEPTTCTSEVVEVEPTTGISEVVVVDSLSQRDFESNLEPTYLIQYAICHIVENVYRPESRCIRTYACECM